MKKLLFSIGVALVFFIQARSEVVEYILQPGDIISIQVVEHPEFSGRHKIRPDGRINYPIIGELDIASLTCAQLVKVMEGKLASYINNPVVSVAIEAYYANKIFVIGEVVRSGEYEIYEPIEVMKALAMCGGMQNPKTKVIKIIRANGSVVDVNTGDFIASGAKSKYVLYPGDTLYVPYGFVIPWALFSTILGLISVSLSIALGVNALSK